MKITMIAGLPGSGKTHLIRSMALDVRNSIIIDDIVSFSQFPEACDHLFVSDVNFCKKIVREKAEEEMNRRYPGAIIEWIFFENDPRQCLINAKRRDDGRNVTVDIKVLTARYEIPEGVNVIPVYRG